MSFSYQKKSIFACMPKTQRAQSLVLGGDPKGKKFLYTHDHNVFIRDIENPVICDLYSEHTAHTSVAKYAPSGFYIASGDESGMIRIWDTTQATHILKYKYQPMSAKINDIAWSPDSKRIAVCGNGQNSFGAVFLWDTGTTIGNVSSHSKNINSLDYKPTRPYRVITASEDHSVAFYEGPPFSLKVKHDKQHKNFVNTNRFSPDGNFFASGCSGGKLNLCDGKSGEFVVEILDGSRAHQGGIYGMSWSPDSSHLLTVSGDKSAKLWDVGTHQLVTKFTLGDTLEDQQLSCLWQGDYMLTVSLSGFINYLDKNNPCTPLRIIKGHNKNINAMVVHPEKKKVFTSGVDIRTLCWDTEDFSKSDIATGEPHASMVNEMCLQDNTITSIGMDDKIRFFNVEKQEYTPEVISLDAQPLSLSVNRERMAVGSANKVSFFKDRIQIFSEKTPYEARSLCFSPCGNQLVVGGDDEKVHVFTVLDNDLKEVNQVPLDGVVNVIKYSPNGKFLAFSADNKIKLYNLEDMLPVPNRWGGQFASVTTIAWSPDSSRFASGGVDGLIFIWDLAQTHVSNKITAAHPKSVIVSIDWLDNDNLVSTSHDKCIIVWSVEKGQSS